MLLTKRAASRACPGGDASVSCSPLGFPSTPAPIGQIPRKKRAPRSPPPPSFSNATGLESLLRSMATMAARSLSSSTSATTAVATRTSSSCSRRTGYTWVLRDHCICTDAPELSWPSSRKEGDRGRVPERRRNTFKRGCPARSPRPLPVGQEQNANVQRLVDTASRTRRKSADRRWAQSRRRIC